MDMQDQFHANNESFKTALKMCAKNLKHSIWQFFISFRILFGLHDVFGNLYLFQFEVLLT